LNGSFGSLVRVILKDTFAPEAAGVAIDGNRLPTPWTMLE
jgi:hypothetical protein